MDEKETSYARMLSGELSPSEEESLRASGEWKEIEEIIIASERLRLPAYDGAVEYQKLVAANKRRKERPRNIRRIWQIGIAASFLICVAIFLFLRADSVSIAAGPGEIVVHEFNDGSIITLNDGSSISFNTKGWSSNRNVTLNGEALFQIEKGAPLVIDTDQGTVQVLGTSFNVRNWGAILSVECYTGKVRVASNGQEVELEKGQAVSFTSTGEKQAQRISHDHPFWLEALSKFEGEDLNLVLEELERQFGVSVNAPDFGKTFSGSFTHSSLERALNHICTPMELSFEFNPGEKTVTISE